MRYFLLLVVFLGGIFTAQAQNNFRTRQDGEWSDPDTWEEFTSSWNNTANVPDSSSGNILIRPFNKVTVTSEVVADQVVVDEDGTLTIQDGGRLIVTNGPGNDLSITVGDGMFTFDGNAEVQMGGIIENRGTILSSAINFSIVGEFIHNQNGGNIPVAGWLDDSKLIVNGIVDAAPDGLNQTFYNFEWDTPGMTTEVTLSGAINEIDNNLTIISTNDLWLTLTDQPVFDLSVQNNFILQSAARVRMSTTGSTILRVNDTTRVSGTLLFTDGSGNATLYATGNFLVDGDLQGNGAIFFNGTSVQVVGIEGVTSGTMNYTLMNNTEISLGESVLTGGSFTVGDDVILHLGSTDTGGTLQATTTGGNVRTDPSSRTFGNNLTLVYDGTSQQTIGMLPSSSNLNLEMLNAAGAKLSEDTDITGDLTLMAGDLILDGHSLTLNDAVSAPAGFYVVPDADASLTLNGSNNLILPFAASAQQLGTLHINRQGNVQLAGDLTVANDLNLEDGLFLMDQYTLNLMGDVAANNGRIATSSTSGLNISGEGTFSSLPLEPGTNQLGRLTLDREGMVWNPSEALTIFEWLKLTRGEFNNSGDLLTLKKNAIIYRSGGGSLTGNPVKLSGGSYDVVYQEGDLTAGLELPDVSTPDRLHMIKVENAKVLVDKETVINGDMNILGGELIIDNADITSFGDYINVTNGSFRHYNGTLYVKNILTITGPDSVQLDNLDIGTNKAFAADNVSISGNISAGDPATAGVSGQLTLNGDDDQQLAASTMAFVKVIVDKSNGDIELQGITYLLDWIRFLQPANLKTNDLLTLFANAADRYAGGSIGALPEGSAVIGKAKVEWYQPDFNPAGFPMFFASPVSDARVVDLQDNFGISGSFGGSDPVSPDPSLYFYDESLDGNLSLGWTAYPETDNQAPLEIGKGYKAIVFNTSATRIDVFGSVNQGEIDMPVTYTDHGMPAIDGWNLVANPYPSAISWDNITGWNKANVSNVIATYEDGKFRYWNGTGAGNGSELAITDGKIARGEAFWVQAASTGSLTINENAKADALSAPATPANQLLIQLEKGAEKDQALVVFSSSATNDYDAGLDAVKLDNAGFDLATFNDDATPLALNFRNNPGCSGSVGVSLGDVTTGNYKMQLFIFEAMEIPYTIKLEDHYLGNEIDITQQNIYLFDVDESIAESFSSDRFTVEFITDVDKIVNKAITVNSSAEVCPAENATIIIPSSQSVVNYQVELNGSPYGSPVSGNGSSLFLEVSNDDLAATNHLKVIASVAYCDNTVYLDAELDVNKVEINPEIVFAGGKLVSNFLAGNAWYLGESMTPFSTENEIVPSEQGDYRLEVTLGSCTASVTYEFTVTGTEDLVNTSWQVYPNPVAERLTVRRAERTQTVALELIALSGQVMLTNTLAPGQFAVDVSGLPEGVYILRIMEEQKVVTGRIVISR